MRSSGRIRLPGALLLGVLLFSACGGKKTAGQDPTQSAEPDKVLYERALEDIKKNKHTVGRLTLQTLINTYPDSEYLAKAKLAICESFYREGGSAGLTQAVAECKDFLTFFPELEEAPYAQMLVAMSHYRRMEKPDRDRTYARLAEEELQQFLLKYPDSPLAPEMEQRLREVQEVLAEGEYRVARFYYIKGTPNGLRAAHGRLTELVDRYPLYSNADEALWMLARIWEQAEQSDISGKYFSRIVREYPLSPRVEDAKKKLEALGVPIPQPDSAALERAQKENAAASTERPGFIKRSLGFMRSSPDTSMAARLGKPNLAPPSEGSSAPEAVNPGGSMSVTGTATAPPANGTTSVVGSTGGNSSGTAPSSTSAPASSSPTIKKSAKQLKKEEELRKKEEERRKKEEEKQRKEEENKRKQEEEQKKKQESSSKKP
jgi:outer membrane protein assembly factor BamD